MSSWTAGSPSEYSANLPSSALQLIMPNHLSLATNPGNSHSGSGALRCRIIPTVFHRDIFLHFISETVQPYVRSDEQQH